MSEERFTGYDGLVTDYLTTELNALADAANVLGAAIDFTVAGVDRKPYMDIEINLPIVNWSAEDNPAIYIWLLARTDGTNFEDGGVGVDPARAPDKIIPLRAANSAQRLFARFALTTPDQAKMLIGNRTGAALNATLNTVKYYTYSREAV